MTMLCYVTRPDAVVMEVEVEAKANGEDCLNQVRPAAGRPLGAGDRWGPEGGAPSSPPPPPPPLMAGGPPPFFPFIYLFSSLLPFIFFSPPPCWMQGLQHPSVAARLPPSPPRSILGKGGRGLLAAPQILPTGAGGPPS